MIERLPTPWGLVRSGVAPDHPKIKSVTRVYEKTAAHPRFRYFGNVDVRAWMSRVRTCSSITTPSSTLPAPPSDRPLGIPGEDMPGSHAATEFVGWYNGHPDHTDLEVDLLVSRACSGDRERERGDRRRAYARADAQGARAAPTPPTMPWRCSPKSAVNEVVIVGSRGPAQAAFTNPELLELGELADADVIVDGDELERALAVHDERAQRRRDTRASNVEILRSYAEREPTGQPQADRPALPALARGAARRRERPPGVGGVCPQRAGRRRATARCARRQPTSTRRSLPACCSARSATAASRCPASPSTSARGVIANADGRVWTRQRRAAAGRVRRRLDQARPLRRDRHQQEGRAGDRRRDPRRPLRPPGTGPRRTLPVRPTRRPLRAC